MLLNITQLSGHKLVASDGDIGHVKDFYFDDMTWAVRYLVADTGPWLTGRLVLLSPHAFGHFDQDGRIVLVNLTKADLEQTGAHEVAAARGGTPGAGDFPKE